MGGASLFQVGHDVEFWRVLVQLSVLAFCLVIFEAALHHVEHKLSQYDKYQHMLRKVYRELMILGLISLGLKLLKEMPGLNAYSKTMLAFQVADLMIFILAIALIVQAIIVFTQLRKHNSLADRIELITAQDLVNAISPPAGTPPTAAQVQTHSYQWFCWTGKASKRADREVVKRRLLRHLFLRRFGLPQLFPFSKYLRRAQAHQISHMIEVEPSMWILLLVVAWSLCGFLSLIHNMGTGIVIPRSHELVEILVLFAWGLVALHVLVLLYFRWCLRQLLHAAGYSENEATLVHNLRTVADEEAAAWQMEAADSALSTMNQVQEELEEIEDCRNAQRHALIRKDVGLQLVATCCRHLSQLCVRKTQRDGRAPSAIQPGSPHIHIRFFSRKAWHVLVMFMLILNGFFIVLIVQCAVYDLDNIYKEFGLVPALLVPLPLALNTLVFEQQIFRTFVMVCSILRVEANTLGEVVNHFSEIVELRSEFATSLLECLKEGRLTIADLQRELQDHDPRQTGMIDVDTLRTVLTAFGFRLTRFRFNSVAMMLFELNGTKVEYGQVLRLLELAQSSEGVNNPECGRPSGRRQHPLLQRTMSSIEDAERSSTRAKRLASLTSRQVPLMPQPSLGAEPNPSDFVNLNTPGLQRLSETRVSGTQVEEKTDANRVRPPMFATQFAGSSSRALHNMFNIRTRSGRRLEPTPENNVTNNTVL